jgi:hypothetical protein
MKPSYFHFICLISFTVLLLISNYSIAQKSALISGKVINGFTKEPIGFASIHWVGARYGVISDSLGNFSISRSTFLNDTLILEYVGMEKARYPLKEKMPSLFLLENIIASKEVVVKSKFSKGLRWWKAVVNKREENNPYNNSQFSCELYNKLELDLNNIDRNGFNNVKLLKPFGFVLDNIDSLSEDKPFLPILVSESISDYFYNADPLKTREIIKGSKISGIRNETILQILGGVNQKMNIYDNYVKLFSKEFVSPISDVADKYYNFKGTDTQYIKGAKVYHLLFTPAREAVNLFSGDMWIDSETWAIHKIQMNIAKTADINYINRLNIVQEFTKQPNNKMVFAKDKITVDLSPFSNDKVTFIGRKSVSYKNISFETKFINEALDKNKKKIETIVDENASEKTNEYWNESRHEVLSKNEQGVFKMIDTLKNVPLFKEYAKRVEFIVDGYRRYKYVEIGPWYKWISGNQLESTRLRFDLGTTDTLIKNWKFNTYLAYGLKDMNWKGRFAVEHKPLSLKGITIQASYLNDLDNGRVRFNEEDVSTDNILSQTLRRPFIPQKFIGIEELKTSITKEWPSNFSAMLGFSRTEYNPFYPLPSRSHFNERDTYHFTGSELMVRFRYAPGERKISTRRRTIRIKNDEPIYELRINNGIKGLADGNYDYVKLHAAINQKLRIPSLGTLNYNVYAGKIIGDSLPFMFLELHPGNEVYIYNRNGFNLMNRFEYYSDQYAGFQVEHNFERKLIQYIPLLNKTKVRQFWTLKGVWGQMNNSNRAFNRTELGSYQLRTLRSHTYLEYGTGFENIFKFFRIDLVWRSAPPIPNNTNPSRIQPIQNFGVFGSMRIQF